MVSCPWHYPQCICHTLCVTQMAFIYLSSLSLWRDSDVSLLHIALVFKSKLSLSPFCFSLCPPYISFLCLTPIHSLDIFFFFVFFGLAHSAEQGVMLLFSVINVCLANTLIISTRANRIDNYTLYTEALSHSLCLSFIPSYCFFHSASSLLSFSVVLEPIVCGICFWEGCGVFPLVIDINEVLLDCVRSGNVCLWCRTKKYYAVAAEYDIFVVVHDF